jgi:hypothetical protein
MNYENMSIEFIINWCKENGQVAWLKAKAKEQTTYKVYPRKKVVDEATGKAKMVADKTAAPKVEKRQISFIQIKRDFVAKFMPELLPKAAEKKPSMYDLIDAL